MLQFRINKTTAARPVPTFFWRFRQNRTTSTSSKMMPIPTMSKGKFDTRVTIRSSVLIWDAESSSIVAV